MWKFTFFLASLLFLGFFLLSPSPAYADEASGNLEQDVNGYRVRLTFSAPAHAGENTFRLSLQDLDNSPLRSARVNLVAVPIAPGDEDSISIEKNPTLAGHYILHSIQELPTPASSSSLAWFGEQPADPNSEATFEHPPEHIVLAMQPGQSNGEYTAVVSFPQAGRWLVFIDFRARDKTQFTQFSLQVAEKSNSPYGWFTGLLAAGALLIGGATLLRRKSMPR